MAKPKTAKRSFKLDLMGTLEAADRGLKDYYSNLTEEERKGFAPKVVMRWLSVLSDKSREREYAILAVNELINLRLYELSKHPELVWLLMTVAGTGKKQYHQWIPTKKADSKTPLFDKLINAQWPLINEEERDLLKSLRTQEEWMKFAKGSALSDKELKDLKDELKKEFTDRGD
jgi:hypothetical protein